MKIIYHLCAFLVVIYTSNAQNHKAENISKEVITNYKISLGTQFDVNGVINADEMYKKYQKMKVSDTLKAKFKATVTEVCKIKGCWMKVAFKNNEDAQVHFKDYSFFVPKNIIGKEVIINGFAFVEELSVKKQKHYAFDSGQSEEDIEKINAPKKSYNFEADGVLIMQ